MRALTRSNSYTGAHHATARARVAGAAAHRRRRCDVPPHDAPLHQHAATITAAAAEMARVPARPACVGGQPRPHHTPPPRGTAFRQNKTPLLPSYVAPAAVPLPWRPPGPPHATPHATPTPRSPAAAPPPQSAELLTRRRCHRRRQSASPRSTSSSSSLDPLLDVLGEELARADGLHHDGHEAVVGAAPEGPRCKGGDGAEQLRKRTRRIEIRRWGAAPVARHTAPSPRRAASTPLAPGCCAGIQRGLLKAMLLPG